MAMLVRITPPGRRSRTFRASGVQRSWDLSGGCATASVPVVLTAEDLERIWLAQVDIFGPLGCDWTGFVWRQPREDEPLQCAGQAVGLTLKPRPRLYAQTRLDKLADYNGTDWGIFKRSNAGGVIEIGQQQGSTGSASDRAGYDYRGDTLLSSMTFSANVNHADISLTVVGLDVNGSPTGTPYSKTATGAQTGQSITFGAGTYGFRVYGNIDTDSTPSAYDKWVKVYDYTLFGTALTTITPHAVVDDCLDALPTWVLPSGDAYRAWVGSPAVTIASLAFTDPKSTDKQKIDAVVPFSDHAFGFYPRRVGAQQVGVPVFQAVSTAPDAMLDVRLQEADDLKEASADSLADNYLVEYRDLDGRARYTSVADASSDNYLNVVGYEKWATVDASFTTSATLAQTAGTVLASKSVTADGSVGVRHAMLPSGRSCHPLRLMPGTRVDVRGMRGGNRALTVTRTDATDADVRVTFGTKATDLRYLAARRDGVSVVRY